MVTISPSSPIRTPWPSRSVPRVWAERRSLGTVVLQADHRRQRADDRRRQIGYAGQPRFDAFPAGRAMTRRRSRNRSTLGPSVTSTSHAARTSPVVKDRRLRLRLLYDAAWRPPPIRSKSPTIPPRLDPQPAAARRRAHGPSRGAERGAAAGGYPPGRPAAGAGRRRHRQDARADHPHRPPFDHRPRPAVADPCRHLHQQGGARDARPRRQPDRRRGRRHVARHLPCHRRARAAPPCRAGRAEEQLHHPRHRRPDAADQAAAAGRGHRRQEMAGPRAVRHHPALEGPRADARQGVGRGCRRVRQRQGGRDLPPVPGAARRGERRRFRRPGACIA